MTALRRGRALICTSAALLSALGGAWGEGGVFQEGDYSILRTGGTEPLLTLELPVLVPAWEWSPRLEFTFGFGTAEPFAAQTFFDSFSAQVENVDSTLAARLLTVDREETVWRPGNPGGLLVQFMDLIYAEVAFTDFGPELDFRCAYTVSYRLPAELAGQPARLTFELFDNGNDFPSMAYVVGVQLTSTPDPTHPPVLQWATAVDGQYEDLSSVQADLVRRELRIALPWETRFLRLNAPVPTRITGFEPGGMICRLRYAVEPPVFEVESAVVAGGPYAVESDLVWDFERQRAIVGSPAGTRFYRIRSTIPAEITALNIEGDRLVLGFAFPGMIPELELAEEVTGPYERESEVQVSAHDQSMSWFTGGVARFFRIRSDRAWRITSIRCNENGIVLTYQ